jgi:prolyl 4-hydroxylase
VRLVLPSLLQKIKGRLRWLYARRYYYLHKVIPTRIPAHNLSYMPDGFSITKVGETGVSIIDGFCSPEEARAVIDFSRDKLGFAGVMLDGKFVEHPQRRCETGLVFGPRNVNQELLPIACRAAALTGLPYTHLEGVYVTRYQEGGLYDEHVDFGDQFSVDRLYTVLLYLNDMTPEDGGATVFPRLNIEVQPQAGRAVCWTNMNPDGSSHTETSHAALLVKPGGEKWAIQFWFHPYKMFDAIDIAAPQAKPGVPLSKDDKLAAGTRYFVKKQD